MIVLSSLKARLMMSDLGCKCQACSKFYKVDLLIPDELWEKIKPEGKKTGAGLLCGSCIMKKIEDLGEFGALYISNKIDPQSREEKFPPPSKCQRCGGEMVREGDAGLRLGIHYYCAEDCGFGWYTNHGEASIPENRYG
jgi:predicted RNA-binding Zn-ribbon protein involved in translation (DUF1610 family)